MQQRGGCQFMQGFGFCELNFQLLTVNCELLTLHESQLRTSPGEK
jgi:hypothetical protein